MYFMSDAPVGMSWKLPDDSIYDVFICFLVPNYVFSTIKWFLIKLLLVACILRYALLLDVLIDICFVFTMYLINLADTNRRYSGYCFLNQIMILMFCMFRSLIGTDMTYHFSADVLLRI